MGLFLSLSGVVGGATVEVVDALSELSQRHSGYLRPATPSENEDTRMVIASGPSGATVLYPGDFMGWDAASVFLSVRLAKPTFCFHIHDGDLWMFHLYVNGTAVTAFCPIPDYWGDVSDEEFVRGDASIVAKYVPNVKAPDIERYFVRWSLEGSERTKAYPDDEYFIEDDWQLCDFMRKIGFVYPLDGNGSPVGDCFSFRAAIDN